MKSTRFAAFAVFVSIASLLLGSLGGAHGYQIEDYSSPDCVKIDASTNHARGTTYADGSAFNGEYLLDKCYGLTDTYNGTANTTYYFETYDPALNAITWSAYNNSDCTPDVAGAKVHSEVEWCGACQSYNFSSSKVTGCPTPVVKKPPTSIKPGTTVSVRYEDANCDKKGAHPSDPHFYQVYDASKQSYSAAGYVYPLNTCYKTRFKNSKDVTDPWKFEQCMDTYDSTADTLTIKCYAANSECDGKWHRPHYNITKKCGECKDSWLVVCPHEIPPTKRMDSVPAGKYAWADYKGPGCTGELSSIDSRIQQKADGSRIVDFTYPIGTCYGWRTKNHTSDEKWSVEYYKDFYDPVAHSMNYTSHKSPTCDDTPNAEWGTFSEQCDKCVEYCGGGWCEDVKGMIDGTISSSSMIYGCPAPPPSPPPVAKPPPPKSADPTENLAAAKAVAEEKKKEAEEKKKVAAEKKAVADEKKKKSDDSKKKADEARDAIVAKIADKKVAVEVKVVAAAAAAGVKLKKLSAPLTAPDATTACERMCTAAKVDCDKNVLCSAELKTTAAARHHMRHLLNSEYTTTLAMPEDATEASSVEDNLKAAGTTPTVTTEDPLMRLNDLSQYIPDEDFQTLKSTTLAASVAKKEADEASVAAVAAEEESTTAEKAAVAAEEEVTAAETEVLTQTQPPPPKSPVVVDEESSAPAGVYSSSGRFTAAVLAMLACGMFQVMNF